MQKTKTGSTDPAGLNFLGQALEKLSCAFRRGDLPNERRRYRRLPAHGTIALRWSDDEDEPQEASVHAINSSPRGIAFRTSSAVPIGQAVILDDGRATLSGLVRRCTPDGGEFAIGVDVQAIECHPSVDEVPEAIEAGLAQAVGAELAEDVGD